MPLLKILTDPQNFRFYAGGQGSVSNSTTFGQKSIRYGNDRFNSANSGQPYITVNIPNDLASSNLIGTTDFLLRGGINVARDTEADVSRIAKMFADTKSPNGLLFIAKQQLLSRTAVRTQTSGILNEGVYTPLSTLAQAGVVAFGGHLNKQGNPFADTGAYANNNSLYFNRIKQLNNTPTTSTETILVNNEPLFTPDLILGTEGLNPNITGNTSFYLNKEVTKYSFTNRLVSLYDSKILTNSGTEPNLYSYSGGPGSFLGAGKTNIKFADQRTGESNALVVSNPGYFYGTTPKLPVPGAYLKNISFIDKNNGVFGKYSRLIKLTPIKYSNLQPYNSEGKLTGVYNNNVYEPVIEGNTWPKNSPLINANNTYTYDQQDIIDTEINEQGRAGSPTIQDFRKVLRKKLGENTPTAIKASKLGATPDTPSYDKTDFRTIESRVYQGDPGQRANKDYSNYTNGIDYGSVNIKDLGSYESGLDQINSIPIYRSEVVATDADLNDLVDFRIAILDNNIGAGGEIYKMFMHFRAFLGPMSDTYSADWTSFKYLGRGENFYTYGGFTRQIALSWTVAAQSKQELMPMYKKLNYLASSLTPDYSPQGYMRGNLAQVTVGGYLVEQPGIITGLTYEIQDDTPWEIGIDTIGNYDGTVKQMPHIIRVSGFNFIPIQNFVPRKQGIKFTQNPEFQTPTETATGLAYNYSNERYISLSYGSTLESSNYNYDNPEEIYFNRQRQNEINQLQGRGL